MNQDNFLYIGRDRRLSADLQMQATDGAGLQLKTEDSDSTSLQNFTLSVHRFEVGQLLSVLPFAPNITGVLDGDYHVVQTSKDITVSGDMNVQDMVFEAQPIGKCGHTTRLYAA